MPKFHLTLTKHAQKFLDKLSDHLAEKIIHDLSLLEDDAKNCKVEMDIVSE